jgi:hypothetical protein
VVAGAEGGPVVVVAGATVVVVCGVVVDVVGADVVVVVGSVVVVGAAVVVVVSAGGKVGTVVSKLGVSGKSGSTRQQIGVGWMSWMVVVVNGLGATFIGAMKSLLADATEAWTTMLSPRLIAVIMLAMMMRLVMFFPFDHSPRAACNGSESPSSGLLHFSRDSF